jgi:hypothetical protein
MEAKKDLRKVTRPVLTRSPSSQCVFQLPMSPLNEAVGLWVVGSRHCVLHTEAAAE